MDNIEQIVKAFEEKFHDGEDRIGDKKSDYSTLGIYEKVESFLRSSLLSCRSSVIEECVGVVDEEQKRAFNRGDGITYDYLGETRTRLNSLKEKTK